MRNESTEWSGELVWLIVVEWAEMKCIANGAARTRKKEWMNNVLIKISEWNGEGKLRKEWLNEQWNQSLN